MRILIVLLLFSNQALATDCTFTWSPSKSTNVKIYRIYKDDKLYQTVNNVLKFVKPGACDIGTYYVKAVNIFGQESIAKSPEKSVTSPGAPLTFNIEQK